MLALSWLGIDISSIQSYLIWVLGTIGSFYASLSIPKGRHTLDLPPFSVRGIVIFGGLIGLLIGPNLEMRVLFVQMISIALGKSLLDKRGGTT